MQAFPEKWDEAVTSRVVVHDYAGHAFPVELSRALAKRGHRVLHLYCSSFLSPRGRLKVEPGDPPTLEVRGLSLARPVEKQSFFRRRAQDVEYGGVLVDAVRAFEPDVVISANTPPDSEKRIASFCRRADTRFVLWMQDSFGVGVRNVLRKRLPYLGAPIAWHYRRLERKNLAAADAIVLITDDFRTIVARHGIPSARVHVVPNWAPIAEVPAAPKRNSWSERHGLADSFVFLYSGTLGLKHRPELLLELAERNRRCTAVRVVVTSEGPSATWLATEAKARGLENMNVLPFQPYEVLPQVLAAADVLVAVLEDDAGEFSVPSKVLTYLCAGRALLLAVPGRNLAARIVEDAGAGIVVGAGDADAFATAAHRLREDANLRRAYGLAARMYAERAFRIDDIADRFETLLCPSQRRVAARPE